MRRVICLAAILSAFVCEASAGAKAVPCGYCWEMSTLKIASMRQGDSPNSEKLTPAHFKQSEQNPNRAVVGDRRIFMGYSHVRPTLQSEVKKKLFCDGPVTYLDHTEFGSLKKNANGVVSISDEINGDPGMDLLPYTVFGVCDGRLVK